MAVKSLGDVGAGHTLGRYELLVPIAQGGMAVVWAARLKGTRGFQKIVAVKSMLPALSDDPQFEQMFLAEAELAARIRHPHVCEILDLGEQEGVLYIVMEWVDGEPLSALSKAARQKGTPIPLHVATRVTLHAALGLHAAHELKNDTGELVGLVHRDVSPQNILVTYDGVVKIVDFGVAKATEAEASHTRAGQLKGKVPFMSPEQAIGKEVDRRTDVFALGICLFQMVTGKHPFRGENDMATLHRITDPAPVPPASAIRPDCPPSLEAAIAQALEKDVDKRYQTMQELAKALEKALAELTTASDGEDLGTFVKSVLGDRAEKRRTAIKDAIRLADARLVARKIGDTSGAVAGGDRPSSVGEIPGAVDSIGPPSSQLSAVTRIETHNSHASGTTGFVVPDSQARPQPAPKGRAAVLALALLAAGGLGAAGVMFAWPAPATPPSPTAKPAALPQPPPTAAASATGASTTAAPEATAATSAAASAAPPGATASAATSAVAAAPSASATAAVGPVVPVGTKVGGPLPKASATPSAAPAAPPSTGMPKVTNPGF